MPAKWLPTSFAATNKVKTVPSPTGGLNARDSLANMPETDALALQNWWCNPYGLQSRPGYVEWATGMPGYVETLASWSGDTQKLFAWAGKEGDGWGVYDVSARMLLTDPPLVPAVTGLSNGRWQTTQMGNEGGNHLLAVNGIDKGIVYDSTGVHRIEYVASPPAPTPPLVDYTWYGLDSQKAIGLTVHQGRLWATEEGSSAGWYMKQVGAIYGEWARFEFGPFFSKGGNVAYMTTWTLDDGNGAEDHLVAVSTEGQAIVYAGTNPDSIDTWKLVGVYFVGEPVLGRRSFFKVGGDMLLLTQRGLISMTAQLVSTKVGENVSALNSEKVQLLISSLVSSITDQFGWELYFNPAENLFMINVPSRTVGGTRQLAANLVTTASPWTQFVNVDAATWETFENAPFFGDYSGRVCKFWDGPLDGVELDDEGGAEILLQVQQAYTYMGAPAVQKQIGMYRPNFLVTGGLATSNSRIEYDFRVRAVPFPSAVPPPSDDLWDVGRWDKATWGGGLTPDRRWIQADGLGNAASLRMSTRTARELVWVSTDYSFKVGTLL